MIPGLLAQDVAQSLREFIVTGFETDTWPFAGKFERLIREQDGGDAFIKGPYVSINLPFAKETDRCDFFRGFHTEHSPFVHQQQAWQRLRGDGSPKSTIVATGTGSGKTECFLYPLLDHCLRHPGSGIKAIVIYPMNALAGDQAKRFASVIHSTPALRGRIRVGLFIGGQDASDQKTMGPEQVITCKNTLRKQAPDILLTNYKMLDFLLMRPQDQSLWQHNGPETLRYLVVDELHTFDGAQGSDLAMLLRRLKARLGVRREHLTCVGTSATLGSKSEMDDLAHYASDIFDTGITQDGIVGESREPHEQFLRMMEYMLLDPTFTPEALQIDHYPSTEAYLQAQVRLFFGAEWNYDPDSAEARQELGQRLRRHFLLHNLLYIARSGPVSLSNLLPALQRQVPAALKDHASQVLLSLLSLLSHARGERYPGEPFVTVRLQLWARELRRIVARVGDDTPQSPVHLRFSDDIKKEPGEIYLPVVQCNECHATAWLTGSNAGEEGVERDLRIIYTWFFNDERQVKVLLPLEDPAHAPPMEGLVRYLCSGCGHLQKSGDACASCTEKKLVTVFEPVLIKQKKPNGIPTLVSQRNCPVCQAEDSLILFGSRAATLCSVAIHQLFADPVNDDKKLIAFSDSVQDAAHRAGFFAARTWQNNVRMGIAKALTARAATGQDDIPLQAFFDYLPEFWLDAEQNPDYLDPINFITQFIAPNLQSHEDYLDLKEKGQLANPKRLVGLIRSRLKWEILAEFGARSQIGRSLERTGVATIFWDPKLIDQAASLLVNRSREYLGYELDLKIAKQVLWGITLRMRRQGAIFDPLLSDFIEEGGNEYLLSRESKKKNMPFMPQKVHDSSLPRFPAEKPERKFERLLPNHHSTWYSRWVLQQTQYGQLTDQKFTEDFLNLAMNTLVASGLVLERQSKKETRLWALNPELLSVTTRLGALRLRRQGATDASADTRNAYGTWHVPEDWLSHLVDLPSLDHAAKAAYQPPLYEVNAHPRPSMYRHFYTHGELRRVIGHEHTALLERGDREALEKRFISGGETRQHWYENLLSATPTLEMGIDIGDLSSVMLCSVPPSGANYLQRAGRGGRRDGNSFVMTLANGHPHDLYFFADPMRMLAGEIQAPAIFLNAIMVLRRQLLAFCFDQWGMHMAGKNLIPGHMQPLLDAVENADLTRFPYTLLEFISTHRDELWDGFDALLGKQVTDETRARLKAYLLATSNEEEALNVYLVNRLRQSVDERKSLIKQQRDLESALKDLKKKPKDEARDFLEIDLSNELEGLKRLKTDLNRRQTLQFFTDDGLLPNYAFPEEGTTLHSVIYRRLSKPVETEDGKTANYRTRTFEYKRPAHAALSELAPESVFYASSRKVQIERVELARGELLETWRLCPSCSYSRQILGADTEGACPRCQDPMWANVKQKMQMVRLRQVYANTREDKAFIGDDSDTREPAFYNRQMLIDLEPEDITLAYAMKSETRSFGFEFIKKASFREINFGKQDSGDQVFLVAGAELSRPGFRLCGECGMVRNRKDKTPRHMYKCKYREAEDEEGFIDCLYLYRQYESEAIRILMPRLSPVTSEEQKQSFVAAIQLGLKKKFGGKVDHLNITTSDEPITGTQERKNYLVLYDTVPGGTGYLHTLLHDPKNFLDMLRLSRDLMAACSCQEDPALDGCYNCLFAYKNSYGMEHTSRKTALTLLGDILDETVELEKVPHLGTLKKSTWADSELEKRFPEAVQALDKHPLLGSLRVRISKDVIKGKVGFKLEVGDLIYTVEPHALMKEKDGVAYPCEPDFLISLDRESTDDVKVAVFLDGYQYHKKIVHEDLMKRQGIFLRSNMLTWSLTWQDLNHVFAGAEAKVPNVYRENIENAPTQFIGAVSEKHGIAPHSKFTEPPQLIMLLRFLAKPDRDMWRNHAMIQSLSWVNQREMQAKEQADAFKTALKHWPSQYLDQFSALTLMFHAATQWDGGAAKLTLHIAGSEAVIKSFDPDALVLSAIYDVKDLEDSKAHRTWQQLLQVLNLGQFLPLFFAATPQGLADGSFANLTWGKKEAQIENTAWDRVLNLVDAEEKEFIAMLATNQVPVPVVGYELADERGAAIAEAELAWEELQIAVLLDYQHEEFGEAFVARGWKVFLPGDIEALLSTFRGEKA
jgi:DEAD/DEAH box helicase domain-containing protein